jgi:hypothetical protein
MGDIGDYWSEAREYRRDARSMWIECSSPGCQFGGNPVKVAPGRKCHHCGEIAPGERGSDTRYARRQEQSRFLTEAEREVLQAMAGGRVIAFSRDGEDAWLFPKHHTGFLPDALVIGLRERGYTTSEPYDEDHHGPLQPSDIITDAGRAALSRKETT